MQPDTDPPRDEGAAPEVLVLAAHPQMEQSRINRAMLQAAAGAAAASNGRIELRDLYALYPDYFIDSAAERARLAAARLVVMQCPVHWYSLPPLLKLWLDEVLAFGWAYGPGGTALQGKDLWLALSTGGSQQAYSPEGYNRYFFDAFLPPMEQTAALCGMRFLPPLVLHGAHHAGEAEVAAHAALYAERLARWPDWPEIAELPECVACVVPADARPAPAGEPR
ncbi:MAG TPA: NAD(P)H-dependent oxidoreductase [Piscinibacter sp.]|nr:NAD(P)H-dependent oxidoreductase [Piscinibacter sp.]